jgi:hypothetical protein
MFESLPASETARQVHGPFEALDDCSQVHRPTTLIEMCEQGGATPLSVYLRRRRP